MKFTRWCAVVALAGVFVAAAPAARAQVYVPYGSYRYYRGRTATDISRRSALRADLLTISNRVRTAELRGRISPRRARNYYGRLNRVRDLLRHDRAISAAEYNRWRNDLRRIRRDLRYSRRR